MRRLLQKISHVASTEGHVGVLRLIRRRIYRDWRTVVFEIRKGSEISSLRWGPDEVFRVYTGPMEPLPDDVAQIIQQHEFDLPATILRGGWGFVVHVRDQCAHFGGVAFNARHTRTLGEPRSTPIIGQCFTMPIARGQGLYKRALTAVVSRLMSAGYDRVLIETHPNNVASIRGIEGAGFVRMHTMHIHVLMDTVAIAAVTSSTGRRLRAWLI